MGAELTRSSDCGLAALFVQHQTELLRFLAVRCGSADHAEDLLQELWVKASTPTGGPVSNGRAYLFRMANNLVVDQARLRRRAMVRDRNWLTADGYGDGEFEDRPDPSKPADQVISDRQEAALLQDAIANLPPGARRALRLHRIDGLGQAEVAQVMGISRSGVEKHLAVAMKHLRNALVDCGLWRSGTSMDRAVAEEGAPKPGKGS